jgi:hypothetical protein
VPNNGLFYVTSLPDSTCQLHRTGPQTVNSGAFTLNADGEFLAAWGGTAWGHPSEEGTYTVWVTCTDPLSRSATSPPITVVWQDPPAS